MLREAIIAFITDGNLSWPSPSRQHRSLSIHENPTIIHRVAAEGMISMIASKVCVRLVVLLLAPALPCTWKQAAILTGSPFDARMFDTFRTQSIYFKPNALTVVTNGPSSRKMLKKDDR